MNKDRLLNRFLKYVQCDSEFFHERQFCLMVEEELRSLGIEPRRDEVGPKIGSDGWNIRAKLPGAGEPILFSCHMDTVSPGMGIAPVVEGGVVRSAGDTILGADDKAGIAAVLEAIESILEEGREHRPVELMFSVCEEMGLLGARHADYSHFESRQALVLDSGVFGELINRAAAFVRMYFEIEGRSAHAGMAPEKGVHALKAAAEAVHGIPCGRVDGDTVMNVANFRAPGKTNIVPDRAAFDMEIRSFDPGALERRMAEAEGAVKAACEKYGASYRMRVDRQSGLVQVPEDSPLMARLAEAYRAMGVEPRAERTFGGSDATWLCAAGMDAVNLGIGMADPHAVTEHIAVKDLERTAEIAYRMML